MDQKYIKNKRIFDKPFSLTPLGLLLAACGGGGGGTATSSSTTNTTSNQTSFIYSGAVVKGPLSNSLVFLDYNKDGKLSSGEPTARTDINGNFNLTGNNGSADIVAIADSFTTDQSTGEKLIGVTLKAPNGSKVVSPTTTLMQETGLSKSEVLSALGLPSNIDPTTFNPYSTGVNTSQALLYEKVSHQIVNTVKGISSALETSGVSSETAFETSLDALSSVISDKAKSGGVLNFSSETAISDVIEKTAVSNSSVKTKLESIKSSVAKAIDNTNEEIAKVDDLTSSVSKKTFAISNSLSDQIKSAGTDATKITFSDKSVVTDQLNNTTTATDTATTATDTATTATDTTTTTTTTDTTTTATTTTKVDEVGPIVTSLSIRDRTVSKGDTIYIDYTSVDDTGTDLFVFWFKDKNGNEFRVVDNDNDGVAELKIDPGYLSGTYTPWFISTLDTSTLKNSLTYRSDGTLDGDIVAGSKHSFDFNSFSFEVAEDKPVDQTAPLVTSLTIDDTSVLKGDTVKINYSVSEETGTDVFVFWFKDQNGNEFRVVDNDADGVAELKIESGFLSGVYDPWFISTLDTSPLQNSATYLADGRTSGDVTKATHNLNLDKFEFRVVEPGNFKMQTINIADTTLREGETLRLNYTLDPGHDAERIYFLWYKPGGSSNGFVRLDEYDLDGVIEWTVPTGSLYGEYELQQFQVRKDKIQSDVQSLREYNLDGSIIGDLSGSTHSFDFSVLNFEVIM